MTKAEIADLDAADAQLAAIVAAANEAHRRIAPIARAHGIRLADVQMLARFAALMRREVARKLAGTSGELFGARP